MNYSKDITELRIAEPTAISLGKFDGVHRGHKKLLDHLAAKKKQGLSTVVFTFDAPPRQCIWPGEKRKLLTTNEEKMHIFEEMGMDYLVECPFTPEIMHMEPEAFVERLVDRLQVKCLVVGTDFHFGYRRRGDCALLRQLADVYGYEAIVVEKVQEEGREISSTRIREDIAEGCLEGANRLLGYPYFIRGEVVYGQQIGRRLNIPTLNLLPPEEKLLPPLGVYVTRTTVDGRRYGGITNVGCKPTIEGEHPIGAETHLFDFGDMVYGKEITVEFLHFVRPERKFGSLEELKAQMERDIAGGCKYYESVTNS